MNTRQLLKKMKPASHENDRSPPRFVFPEYVERAARFVRSLK
jgi:hypothetical protein